MSASDLDRAIEANNLNEVKRLVESGADLARMGDYDATPLANAAALGHAEIVQYLLKAGADPELGGCRSVLVNACGLGYYDVCKILLDGGANPNEEDDEGDNCLGMAIFKARLKIIKLLIERGANPDPLDDYIGYAVELNSNGSHDEVISYLQQLQVSRERGAG